MRFQPGSDAFYSDYSASIAILLSSLAHLGLLLIPIAFTNFLFLVFFITLLLFSPSVFLVQFFLFFFLPCLCPTVLYPCLKSVLSFWGTSLLTTIFSQLLMSCYSTVI